MTRHDLIQICKDQTFQRRGDDIAYAQDMYRTGSLTKRDYLLVLKVYARVTNLRLMGSSMTNSEYQAVARAIFDTLND